MDSSRNWWKVRNYKGESGYCPYTILKEVSSAENGRVSLVLVHPVVGWEMPLKMIAVLDVLVSLFRFTLLLLECLAEVSG